VQCETLADTLQDVMANTFPDPCKLVAKAWLITCEIWLFYAYRHTELCSLESRSDPQLLDVNLGRNQVLQGFGNHIFFMVGKS
jgi:hypothetical protein